MKIQKIRISELEGSPYQPRREISPAAIDELAASIDEQGALQPILVRPVKKGNIKFQIVAGHRRKLAHEKLGFDAIDAVVRPMTDLEAAVATGTENIQREDLTGYEEHEWMLNVARLYEAENGKPPSLATLSKITGEGINWVRNRHQIADYRPDVLGLVKRHKNIISSTGLINKITDADQRAELIEMVDKGASFNDIKTAIDAAAIKKQITSTKAPDVATQRAITTGNASISRGKPVTSTPASEAKSEIESAIVTITGKLATLESFIGNVDEKYFCKKVEPHIRRWQSQLERIAK